MDPSSNTPSDDAGTVQDTGTPPSSTEAFLRKIAGDGDTPAGGPRSSSEDAILGPPAERFESRRRLGEGGFGTVYEVFDRERNARVALKMLARHDPRALYRFKQEFRTLADISHPNLVQLYELHGDGEQWFFTMELVHGQDARSYVREPVNVFDETRLRAMLRQLAAALCFLHDAGKLHRDIKPSNVMVDRDGKVVLLDFGLAVDLTAEGGQSVQVIAGTPHYMAPEQAVGDPTGPPADWYAVGVLLYQALTGRLPFEGSSIDVIGQKVSMDPRPPSELAPGVPEDLDKLCLDLLQRTPSARPSGREVQERLAQHEDQGLLPHARAPKPKSSALAEDGSKSSQNEVFVGRRAQLEELHEAFRAVRSGHTGVALVHGRSGMGKSALIARFLSELRERQPDLVILRGRCFEQESVPYKAMDSLMDALGRHLGRLAEGKIHELLPRDAGTMSLLFPALKRVPAIESAPRRPETSDKLALRRRAFAALRDLFARLGDRAPLLLFIDDLQWGDVDGGALLADLLRPPDAPSMLVVLAYRADEAEHCECLHALLPALRAASGPALGLTEVVVGELSEAEARELAIAELGERSEAPPAFDRAAAIARESGGWPFFIRELCLSEGADLEAHPSLEATLWSRIAALPEGERRLLQVIALAGRPIRQSTALRCAELGDEGPQMLGRLRQQRLLRMRGDRSKDAVETYHDRIRETVTGRLSPEAKKELHLGLAAALTAAGHADAETLAVHYHAAGEIAKAADHMVIAADQAMEAFGFDRAARLYRQAIACIEASDPRRRELHEKLGAALGNIGRGPEASEAYLAAVPGASETHALELRSRAAEHYLISGRSDDGIAVLRAVLDATGLSMPATGFVAAVRFLFLNAFLWFRGYSFLERPFAEIPPQELLRIDACSSVAFGMINARPLTALYFHKRFLLLALRAGDPYRALVALLYEAGYVASRSGEAKSRSMKKIERVVHPLIEKVRGSGPRARAVQTGIEILVGSVAVFQGRFREAREHLERGMSGFDTSGVRIGNMSAIGSVMLIGALYALGEWKECSRRHAELLGDARARGDLFLEIELTKGGHVSALMADQPDAARDIVNRVEELWSRADRSRRYARMAAWGDIALYEDAGIGARALSIVNEGWASLVRSGMLLFSTSIRVEALFLRGRASVAAAAVATDVSQRADLLRTAERDARRMGRVESRASRAFALMIRAAVATGYGDRDQARDLLREADAAMILAELGLHAVFCRRRLGELTGGDDGREIIESADALMRAQDIRNPARMTAMFLPGRW